MKPKDMTEYEKIQREIIQQKTSTIDELKQKIEISISNFETQNRVVELLNAGTFSINHYHNLLINLFHQVAQSASTFALAGCMTSDELSIAKSYLILHAEEEHSHWTWIISDLRATGYTGPDPRTIPPPHQTTAYMSYAHYLALKNPIGRLVMGMVLESISARFGVKYSSLFVKQAQLNKSQVKFFLGHGELDQGHAADIFDVLSELKLTGHELYQLGHIAVTTSILYKELYNIA
jgi:hypothetical protein